MCCHRLSFLSVGLPSYNAIMAHGALCISRLEKRHSCRVAMVVLEQPAEAFATLCWPFPLTALANHRKEQHVALALMIPFAMVIVHVLVQHMPQGAFTKQHHP